MTLTPTPHKEIDPKLHACALEALRCHHLCWEMATTHCLRMGGKHVEQDHLRLMLNCAELCLTAAHFMLSASPHHKRVCEACAQVCADCADSCDRVGDMDDCARMCRYCAESCGRMAA